MTVAAADPTPIRPRLKAGDLLPWFIAPALALVALPLAGSPATWATLTVAGLAMGMMIFVMASGLTLVFGLMDVLNFGHGAFVSIGAYVAVSGFAAVAGAGVVGSETLPAVLGLIAAGVAAMAVTGALGYVFERAVIMPVYGAHLKQILITMGGLIVAEEMIKLVWGPHQIPAPKPEFLKGAIVFDAFPGFALEKYRLVAALVGLAVFLAMLFALNRTKLGLLIRAGVENGEMVQALGYRIRRLFALVFIVGSALAGLGGAMWGFYQEIVSVHMGMQMMVLIFIVVIIGGLGSIEGAFLGAILVGLTQNYMQYLAPKVALGSNILLMALILLWRPRGLFPVSKA